MHTLGIIPQFPLLTAFLVAIACGVLSAPASVAQPVDEDVSAPRNVVRFDCGGRWARVEMIDSSADDLGLDRVEFVSELSDGVAEPSIPQFEPGTGRVSFLITTISGRASGRAVLIAEDVAGNVDTVQINFLVNVPGLNSDTVLMDAVKQGELRRDTLTIENLSPLDDMVIDSIYLRTGNRFSLADFGNGATIGLVLYPGETHEFVLNFQSGLRGEFFDTLAIYVDCDSVLVPLHAIMARPIIDLDDVDFWQVLVGGQKCQGMGLRNVGNDDLVVSAIEVGGEYQFDTTALPDVPVRLEPSQSITIPICFIPRQLGVQVGSVTVESSATNDGTAASRLVGIGVNSVAAVGYDNDGNEVQLTVVSQGPFLTIVSADRDRDLTDFGVFNIRGEEIPYDDVEKIGEGWWQINLPARLLNGLYYMFARSPGRPHVTVKFVVFE